MTMEIHLSGIAAMELEPLARAVLRSLGRSDPICREEPAIDEPGRGKGIAVAALFLGLPGAIVSTSDLAERAKLSEHVHVLIEKAQAMEATVTLCVGSSTPLDLSLTSVDEVMNLLFCSSER